MATSERLTPERVYPGNVASLAAAAVGYAAVAALCLLAASAHFLFGSSAGPSVAVWLARLALIAATVWSVVVALKRLLNLLRAPPLFLLDGDGIEAATGRISWRDVARIRLVGQWTGNSAYWWLLLELRPHAQTLRAAGSYRHGDTERVPVRDARGLHLPFWAEEASSIEAIRHFYRGPIDEDLTLRETSPWH
jgi:hypothetical protein